MNKNVLIIGVSAKAEGGKSTFARVLKNKIEEISDLKVVIQPIAARLKDQAKYIGWDGEKDSKGRTLLQHITNSIKEYHGNDIYAKWCIEDAMKEKPDVIIIDDMRFLNEANYFKNLKGFETLFLRLERENYKSHLSEEQLKDPSECELDDYKHFKYILRNNGNIECFNKYSYYIAHMVKDYYSL